MNNPDLLNGLVIGVVIGACMLVIKLVDFMLGKYGNGRARNGNGHDRAFAEVAQRLAGVDMQKLVTQTDTMFMMHAKTDADGVPVWYVRRSLENVIHELANSVNGNTQLIREQGNMLQQQSNLFRELVQELREMRLAPPGR